MPSARRPHLSRWSPAVPGVSPRLGRPLSTSASWNPTPSAIGAFAIGVSPPMRGYVVGVTGTLPKIAGLHDRGVPL